MQYATRPHWYIGMPGMHNIGLGTYMVVDTHGYRMDVVEACSRAVVYATSKKHTTTCVQLDIVSAILQVLYSEHESLSNATRR